jgi:hypothetical protein
VNATNASTWFLMACSRLCRIWLNVPLQVILGQLYYLGNLSGILISIIYIDSYWLTVCCGHHLPDDPRFLVRGMIEMASLMALYSSSFSFYPSPLLTLLHPELIFFSWHLNGRNSWQTRSYDIQRTNLRSSLVRIGFKISPRIPKAL